MGRENLYICTIDMEKAFDTLPRTMVWECLEEYGFTKDLQSAIKDLYRNTANKPSKNKRGY